MPKGQKHHVRVMGAAAEIVRRLRETPVTVTGLMDEYECGYPALMKAVLSQITRQEYRRLAKKRLAGGGVAGRFEPGHETWNAGKKGWFAKGVEATWFTQGGIRGAAARKYRAIGTVIVRQGKLKSHYKCARRRQSQRWIKVAEGRYVPYARYLWEQAHGPVPEGMFVVHANHRLMDDRLTNLVLVDCAANARRLRQRPGVEAKRIGALRRALTRRRREGGAARHWVKEQIRRSIMGWECDSCGADVAAGTVQCPKCGSGSISQTQVRPMPESEAREGMERRLMEVVA